jgi:hypothetical protein
VHAGAASVGDLQPDLELTPGEPVSSDCLKKLESPPVDSYEFLRGEGVAAVFEGAGDFGHAVGVGGDFVFEFDGALDGPFVVANGVEDIDDGGIAFSKGCVGAFVLFAVFEVDVGDAFVVFLNEGNRGGVVAGDEVADIHIGAVEFGEGEGFFPVFGFGFGVAVVADEELVFVREGTDAREVFFFVGNFRGDGAAAKGFGEGEGVIEFGVAHFEDAVHFDDLDDDARVFVFLAEIFGLRDESGFAPVGKFFGVGFGFGAGGFLFFGGGVFAGGFLWVDPFGGGAEENFDGLGAEFDAADVELNAVFEDVVAAHGAVGEAVGDVEAELDAGDFGVGLGGGGISGGSGGARGEGMHSRGGQDGKGEFGKLAAG